MDKTSNPVVGSTADDHDTLAYQGQTATGIVQQPEFISRSWKRCEEEYRLSPDEQFSPVVLDSQELGIRRDASSDTLELARNSVEKLYALIADIGYSVLLTDNQGIALDCRYDPSCEAELKKQGLYAGADWSESIAGTNGVGTCLVEEAAVIVRNENHYLRMMHGMTCTVSPIFDSQGKLVASLDASTIHPETIGQNKLVSRLVEQHARQIESQYFVRDFGEHWLLRFSPYKDTSDSVTTGIVAIREDGRILAGTRTAHKLLCRQAGQSIRQRNFHEIFDASFLQLQDAYSRTGCSTNRLRAIDVGKTYFFNLLPPVRRPAHSQNSARGTGARRHETGKRSHPGFSTLIGSDKQMQLNARRVKQTIDLDLNILIIGETGTGKEAMARAIHQQSERRDGPFVAINCAAIPDSLIESELFGYSSGTFTGALKKGMKGRVLQANGGTLFLDEIGDMPVHLQTRLLRMLSEMEVVPLGEVEPIALDIQLISATNRTISDLSGSDLFRSDLYFRLNGVTLNLPSLRERTDKRELIASVFDFCSAQGSSNIDVDTMELMLSYNWPGNIRQLINVAKYASAMAAGEPIQPEHLPFEIEQEMGVGKEDGGYYSEHEQLLNSLRSNKWNVTQVSRDLDICRATVYRKMKKYNIVPPNELSG